MRRHSGHIPFMQNRSGNRNVKMDDTVQVFEYSSVDERREVEDAIISAACCNIFHLLKFVHRRNTVSTEHFYNTICKRHSGQKFSAKTIAEVIDPCPRKLLSQCNCRLLNDDRITDPHIDNDKNVFE